VNHDALLRYMWQAHRSNLVHRSKVGGLHRPLGTGKPLEGVERTGTELKPLVLIEPAEDDPVAWVPTTEGQFDLLTKHLDLLTSQLEGRPGISCASVRVC
jgi:hypothetical protein